MRDGCICTEFEYIMTRREGDPKPLYSTLWLAQDPTCPVWRQSGSCWFENLDYGSMATWHGNNNIGSNPTLNLHMIFDYRGAAGIRQRNTHGVENKWARVYQPPVPRCAGYFRGTDYLQRIIELVQGPSFVASVRYPETPETTDTESDTTDTLSETTDTQTETTDTQTETTDTQTETTDTLSGTTDTSNGRPWLEWTETDTSIFTMRRPAVTNNIDYIVQRWNRSAAARGHCRVGELATFLS